MDMYFAILRSYQQTLFLKHSNIFFFYFYYFHKLRLLTVSLKDFCFYIRTKPKNMYGGMWKHV